MNTSDLIKSYNSGENASFILENHIYAYKKYLSSKKELSNSTITEMMISLHNYDKYLMLVYPELTDVKELNSYHIKSYVDFNLNDLLLQNRTTNKKLRAVRYFLDYLCNARNIIEHNPAYKIPYLKVEKENLPKYMPKPILKKVLNELSYKKNGIRDITITKFLAYVGLQLGEIIDLKVDQIDLTVKKLYITRDYRDYEFDIPNNLYLSLKEYILLRNSELENDYTDYLFLSNKGNRYVARSYQYAFKDALISADIDGNYTPRHVKASFAYYMAQVASEETLSHILNQNKVKHYYVENLNINPLLPK